MIIPPRSVETLAEAMLRMVEDKTMRKQMAENAREMIVSRFEKNFVQKCQIEFYKEVM